MAVGQNPDRDAERATSSPTAPYLWLLADLVAESRDVVWDHGLWPRKDRDVMRGLVGAAGGRWRLLYIPVEHDELLPSAGGA